MVLQFSMAISYSVNHFKLMSQVGMTSKERFTHKHCSLITIHLGLRESQLRTETKCLFQFNIAW